MRNAKGQNMIEYLMLVVAVLIVCIYFYSSSGPLPTIINASVYSIVNEVQNLNSEIQINNS